MLLAAVSRQHSIKTFYTGATCKSHLFMMLSFWTQWRIFFFGSSPKELQLLTGDGSVFSSFETRINTDLYRFHGKRWMTNRYNFHSFKSLWILLLIALISIIASEFYFPFLCFLWTLCLLWFKHWRKSWFQRIREIRVNLWNPCFKYDANKLASRKISATFLEESQK